MNKVLLSFALILGCSLFIGNVLMAKSEKSLITRDTTMILFSKSVLLINDNNPIIIQKGEILNIKVEQAENEQVDIRIHSSLGRLVREFKNVYQQINYKTDHLLAGIYLVVIKRADVREIRKVLITD